MIGERILSPLVWALSAERRVSTFFEVVFIVRIFDRSLHCRMDFRLDRMGSVHHLDLASSWKV